MVQILRIRMEETLAPSKLVQTMITQDNHHLRSNPTTPRNRLHTVHLHLMIHIIGDQVLARPHMAVSELLQVKINFSHRHWHQRRIFTITAMTRKNQIRHFARVGQGLRARSTNHPLIIITQIPDMLLRRCRHLMGRTIDRQASCKRAGSPWQGHGGISDAAECIYIIPFIGTEITESGRVNAQTNRICTRCLPSSGIYATEQHDLVSECVFISTSSGVSVSS